MLFWGADLNYKATAKLLSPLMIRYSINYRLLLEGNYDT
jgi:hypothetical protein